MNSTKSTSVVGTHINSIASKLMEKHQQKALGTTSLQRSVTMPEVPIDPRVEKRKASDEGLFTSSCTEKRCKKNIPKKWISDRKNIRSSGSGQTNQSCSYDSADPHGQEKQRTSDKSKQSEGVCSRASGEYKCNMCADYGKHQAKHSDYKTYQCFMSGCNKSFSYMHQLKNHNRTHSNVKGFKCKICTFTTKHYQGVNAHFNKKHPHSSHEGRKWVQIDIP